MHGRSNVGMGLLVAGLLFCGVVLLFPVVTAYLIVAVAVASAVAVAFIFGYVAYWLMRHHWFSPTRRVRAKVLRKRHKQWDISLQGETPEITAARMGTLGRNPDQAARAWLRSVETARDLPELTLAEGTDCYMTFEFGATLAEFRVPMADYIKTEEGTEGLLVYRGEQFKHFIPGIGQA